MKKTIILAFLIGFSSILCAINVNVMTNSGEVVTGVLIGSDENALFVKTADGNAKTIKYGKVSKIFDAETAKDITDRYKAAEQAKPSSAAAKPPQASSGPRTEYETIEESSGTINLRENVTIFTRTVPKYFGVDVALMQFNLLFGDNKKLKEVLKPYAVDSGGYTYDSDSMMVSFGLNADLYIRPIDGFGFGGFYNMSFANQNLSVHRNPSHDGSEFMYIDLPVTSYGALIKLIPFSTAIVGSDGELVENFAWSLDLKLGASSLGTLFSAASINDENSIGDAVDLSGTAPYFAVEMVFSSQMDLFKFGIGYQQSEFAEIKAAEDYVAHPGITEPIGTDYYVMAGGEKIPFVMQGVYMYLALAF